MKSAVLWALVVINVLLFVSFLGRVVGAPTAIAQPANRRPADYLIVPGEVSGATAGIIYVLDVTNDRLSATSYDENARRMVSMRSIDLTTIFGRAAEVQQPPQQPQQQQR